MKKSALYIFILLNSFVYSQTTTQTLTSSGSMVIPCGITSITVQCWGGGGAGGGATSNNSAGGGGAGGAYSYSVIGVTYGQTITYVIGGGGNGDTGTGNSGGSSSFGGVIATGGAGGGRGNSNNTSGNGGTASSAGSVGSTIFTGGDGGTGSLGTSSGGGGGSAGTGANGTSGLLAVAGIGGLNGGGNGGAGGGSNSNGSNGAIPGGGGGGARRGNNNDRDGGNGARGQIVISYTGTPVVANAGVDQTIISCSTSTAAIVGNTVAAATGSWTCLSGCSGVTITTPTVASTKVTGLTPNTAVILRWSLTSSTASCTSVDNMQIIVNCTATNDNPCSATAAPVNTTAVCNMVTPGTVYGATQSTLASNCSSGADDDVWFSFVANSTSQDISILNIAGSTTDLYHAVYQGGSCNTLSTTAVVCSDPNNSTASPLTIGITYYVRVFTLTGTGGQNTVFNLCLKPTPAAPTNTTCAAIAPVCSDSPVSFQAQATGGTAAAGPNYGCLSSRPNPTWFYLQVANPGDLAIDITANSDVDFALWGPYPSLAAASASCTSYPTPSDCSYSNSNIEQANITSGKVGDVYVLLVTNYAGKVQTINLTSSDFSTGSTNCAIVPTPIELIEFKASIIDERNVLLNWSTATETNNNVFEIERSENGYSWELIGTKKGAGTTTIKQQYKFVDINPLKNISYYRLKQIDFDKSFAYSNIVTIDYSSFAETINNVHPNPSNGTVYFDWKSEKESQVSIELIDFKGVSVYKNEQNVEIGTTNFKVDVSEYNSGIYMLKVTSSISGKTSHYKLMKP